MCGLYIDNFILFLKIIYLFLAALGFCCCKGFSLVVPQRLLIAAASLGVEYELQDGGLHARVTAGQKRPHLGVCPGPNIPLQGRQGSRGCIPGIRQHNPA